MSSRRQKFLTRVNWYLQSSLNTLLNKSQVNKFYYKGGRYRQVSLSWLGWVEERLLWSWHAIRTILPWHMSCSGNGTVETLYSTIYYSKYFIELNFDKSTQYVALWTHKRHPIPRPFGRAMECLLWVFHWNWPCYKGFLLYMVTILRNSK